MAPRRPREIVPQRTSDASIHAPLFTSPASCGAFGVSVTRPFTRTHAALPQRRKPHNPRAHRAGTEAVERALFPLAADLASELRGCRNFPRSLQAAEAVGV